ncbi:hypothetical protein L210DRAFT_936423 [Boletus edulis BED1]|uniref:NADH dehydrogenase subunit 4 n=1 Tax=Boletus edulis BED1 TaxID=1328754 RepID=A0AAD4G7D0_BOLED|nr:hypothetical protein L210DRAFT_936423 [Boletus edulis BED1]
MWSALSFSIFSLLPAFVVSDHQHSPLVRLSFPSTVNFIAFLLPAFISFDRQVLHFTDCF